MLDVNISFLLKTTNSFIQKALHLYQLGHFQWALDDVVRAELSGDDLDQSDLDRIFILKNELARELEPVTNDRIQLVWGISPDCWERDWIMYLLRDIKVEEVYPKPSPNLSSKNLIVVDNRLNKEKVEYYRNLYRNNCRIFLIHLSDENYKDDYEIYSYCSLVYRNLWSPFLSIYKNIKSFPLGVKCGFKFNQKTLPASERPWTWGFAGDINKSTRQKMAAEMNKIQGGRIYTTSGFASADALPVSQYQDFLTSITFAPCPAGFTNIDSFRFCESLEAGAIPIVEKRHNYNYYKRFLGENPIPVISDWSEAPHLIESLMQTQRIDELQRRCQIWWNELKTKLQEEIAHDIANMLSCE